ncbi:MAG: tRNA (guanosine(37)-N1)-methyltransferase TrmD [Lachnospiraceae bacterium]|nr:tRNA (guanosine(37)-N1)-methyltransferase TrmD [Lachnospiraceae bacterium]
MNFYIMTLFPDMVEQGLNTSIIGRATEKGLLSIKAVDIRAFSEDKHKRVDDYPYGGGAGMVMAPDPVVKTCAYVKSLIPEERREKTKVVYLTPQGETFTQKKAEEWAKEEDLIFLCGHYEGIDERALEMVVTDMVSAGDYVLTGGELPAMMMIDAVSRLVPGVLNNEASAEFESFQDNLLEYPQYTRPEEYEGRKVPEVLLSGHHANIEKWRREKSIERTLAARPDLLKDAVLSKKEKQYLDKLLAEKCRDEEKSVVQDGVAE